MMTKDEYIRVGNLKNVTRAIDCMRDVLAHSNDKDLCDYGASDEEVRAIISKLYEMQEKLFKLCHLEG